MLCVEGSRAHIVIQILNEPCVTWRSECHLITGDLNESTIDKLHHDADSADAF